MGKQDILMHNYVPENLRIGGSWWSAAHVLLSSQGLRTHDVSVPKISDEQLGRVLDLDPGVIFLYWRWPMESQPDRHSAYERQLSILDWAMDKKKPIVIFDGDLQPGAEEAADAARYAGCQVKLVAPMLYPKAGYEQLFYPMVHYSWAQIQAKRYDFCYVGNNYGRYDSMKTVLNNQFFAQLDNRIFGNWMKPSPYRASPETVKLDFPFVQFFDPIQPFEAMLELSSARFTYHFAKPEYERYGFVTMRWQEAAAAGCLGFATDEFRLTKELELAYRLPLETASSTDRIQYLKAVKAQYQTLRFLFPPINWSSFFYDMTKAG